MPRLRFLRAYTVTLRIILRYLVLFFARKIFGIKRCEKLAKRLHAKTSGEIIHHILILKGIYIKVGQTLSIMTNFFPPELTEGLEKLQDAVPPHPYIEIEKRFLQDFGKSPKEIFAEFDEIPLASASLGQVHQARLADGTKLAVKLQYPNIDHIITQDLKVIRRIFWLINLFLPHYGLTQVYAECAEIILRELDYTQEGKSLETIQNNFKDNKLFYFPKVYWEYSSKTILALEFIEGIKITHVDKLKEVNLEPRDIAVSLIHAYCKQIFIDGHYHADPHPGNIIVSKPLVHGESPYQISLIDFGATAQVSAQMKAGMILFVEGLIKRETRMLSQGMKQMGFLAREDNDEAFDKIVDYFYSKIRGIKIENFKQINITDFQRLSDIFELQKMDISLKKLTQTFHVPKEWILLERTLILMMGLVAQLDPYLNPVDIVLPYVEEFALGKDKKITDILIQTSKELILSYIQLPNQLNRILKKFEEGKLPLNSRSDRHENILLGIRQLTTLLFGISFASFSYLFYKDGNGLVAHKLLMGFYATIFLFVFQTIRMKK